MSRLLNFTSAFLRLAYEVLREQKQPMSARAIWDFAHENRHRLPDADEKLISGHTPHQTMKAKLSMHIRRYGVKSVFVRTAPGRFFLRDMLGKDMKAYDAPPLAPPGASERVLVFPTEVLDRLGRFQGIMRRPQQYYRALLNESHCRYLPRAEAERDDRHKQVVSYVLVMRHNQLLAFKRGNYTRTDELLRGSHCVGFGGHVVEADLTFFNRSDLGVADSALREVQEELQLPDEDKRRFANGEGLHLIGVLNDDSSDVGRRHIAFVFQYQVSASPKWDSPLKGEKAVTQLRWLDPATSAFSLRDFEYWSQLCLRTYFAPVVKALPSFLVRRKAPLMPPHLLCVLGPVGSGKTEAASILTRDYGYIEINSGRVLARLMGIPPIPQSNRETFQGAAQLFISTPDGPKQLAQAIWEEIKMISSPRILVDGIRNLATLDHMKRLAEGRRVGLLYVHTLPDVAYRFYQKRTNRQITIHDFLRIRESPVEKEVARMITNVDAVLYNWTGRLGYRKAIRDLMRELAISERHHGRRI